MKSKNIDPQMIISLHQKGLKTGEIAKELDIASSAVSYWKKKLKLPIEQRKEIDWDAIQKDHNDGMSYRKLAEKYGINPNTLLKARKDKRFNLVERPKLTEEQLKKRQRESWMRYYSRKKYQTPADENIEKLKEFYENCPDGYHVDHIIPISKGGLHSLSNLQYLSAMENWKKSNKLI